MIAYRVARGESHAIVRLAIRKRKECARLESEGDDALGQEVRWRIMHHFQIAPREFSSIAGDWLCQWMESREMRDLNPVVTEGYPIVRYGGTFSQNDCRKGTELIAEWLVVLATLARDPIWAKGGTYEWEHMISGWVMMLVYERAAWRASCGGIPEHAAALDPAIRAQLAATKSTVHYEPSQLLAAFDRAKEFGQDQRILPEYWRILDTEGGRADA